MNKYQNGKIYAIKSPNTEKIYIGSTTQKYLSSRLAQHNGHMKSGKINISSSEILMIDIRVSKSISLSLKIRETSS